MQGGSRGFRIPQRDSTAPGIRRPQGRGVLPERASSVPPGSAGCGRTGGAGPVFGRPDMKPPESGPRASGLARGAPGGPLSGRLRIPGDKSISHRAFLISALTVGESRVVGGLDSDDVRAMRNGLQQLGVGIERTALGSWRVHGVGAHGLAPPDGVLDCGNSGTAARLLAGALAGHAFPAVLTGDASLRQRPMRRVIEPLAEMGAEFVPAAGGRLPMTIAGTGDLLPLTWHSSVASAQVKTCVLLAGLHASGTTTVVEPRPSRDHGERMLRAFGAEVSVRPIGHGNAVSVPGDAPLHPADIAVPGDVSSAAFPLVAALLADGSDVELLGVGVNRTRTGILDALRAMGADFEIASVAGPGPEPVADLRVRGRAGRLRAVDLGPDWVPRTIDEYPALAVAAACADGVSRFRGLGELRVKESDRLEALRAGLDAVGVAVRVEGDDLLIEGTPQPRGGVRIGSGLDHRIAMAFLVLGTACAAPVDVEGAATIRSSWPGFGAAMRQLGAAIRIEADP